MAFPVEEMDAMAALVEGVRQEMALALLPGLQCLAASCAEVCVQRLLELRGGAERAAAEEARHHCRDAKALGSQAARLQEAVRRRMSFAELLRQPEAVREMALDESEIGPGGSDDDGASSLEDAYERLEEMASGRLTVCQQVGCNEIAPQHCRALLCRRHCLDGQCPCRAGRRAAARRPRPVQGAGAAEGPPVRDKGATQRPRQGKSPTTPTRWTDLRSQAKDDEPSGHSDASTDAGRRGEAAGEAAAESPTERSDSLATCETLSEPAPEAPCGGEEPEAARGPAAAPPARRGAAGPQAEEEGAEGGGEPQAEGGEAPGFQAGDELEVIGGKDLGGILVRAGRTVATRLEAERLATGALIRVLQFQRGRLRYDLLEGTGPSTGWISAECRGRPLLQRRAPLGEAAGESEPRLALAVRAGDKAEVQRLLLQGVDPNELDAMGEPPIFEAVMNHAHPIAALLLVARADPQHRTTLGVTAVTLTDGDEVSEELLKYPQVDHKSSAAHFLHHAREALDGLLQDARVSVSP